MAGPTCNDCRFWEPYAPGLGECTEYVARRAAAWATWPGTATSFEIVYPRRPAPDTEDSHTCDQHEPIT